MKGWNEDAIRKIGTKPRPAERLDASEYKEQQAAKKRAKPLKMPKSETANQITKNAVLWLNLNGFKAWRQNNGGVWDPVKQCFRKSKDHLKGIPDICGFCKRTGRALYIEVKAGRDKKSPEQIQFLADANKAGAITGVIKASAEIEAVISNYLNAA